MLNISELLTSLLPNEFAKSDLPITTELIGKFFCLMSPKIESKFSIVF